MVLKRFGEEMPGGVGVGGGGHFEVTVIENMEHLTILLKYCVSSFSIPDEILISVIL